MATNPEPDDRGRCIHNIRLGRGHCPDCDAANQPRCYHPQLSHAACPAGHPVHLDVDHYDTPRWVHCTIADLVQCPHDLEDVTGAAQPGKHRATPTSLSGCTCGGIGDTGSHFPGCAWAA